jgi:lipoyl(octanoyl) transferase
MSEEILVLRCGIVPYDEARALQRRLQRRRQAEAIPDVLLLLEHPPVYTRGRRCTPEELPMGASWYEAQGIEIRDTDRGGFVTYHGPGQLVAYPIVALAPYGNDVHTYIRKLERVMIGSLGDHGVPAQTIENLTGVWTEGNPPPGPLPGRRDSEDPVALPTGPPAPGTARKIGSIGLHISRGVTSHGLAVNVNNDLQPFEWIVPCQIEGCAMTSLSRELGAEQDLDAFASTIVERFAAIYERSPIEASHEELASRIGAGAAPSSASPRARLAPASNAGAPHHAR